MKFEIDTQLTSAEWIPQYPTLVVEPQEILSSDTESFALTMLCFSIFANTVDKDAPCPIQVYEAAKMFAESADLLVFGVCGDSEVSWLEIAALYEVDGQLRMESVYTGERVEREWINRTVRRPRQELKEVSKPFEDRFKRDGLKLELDRYGLVYGIQRWKNDLPSLLIKSEDFKKADYTDLQNAMTFMCGATDVEESSAVANRDIYMSMKMRTGNTRLFTIAVNNEMPNICWLEIGALQTDKYGRMGVTPIYIGNPDEEMEEIVGEDGRTMLQGTINHYIVKPRLDIQLSPEEYEAAFGDE